jgi:hypothetical protein
MDHSIVSNSDARELDTNEEAGNCSRVSTNTQAPATQYGVRGVCKAKTPSEPLYIAQKVE